MAHTVLQKSHSEVGQMGTIRLTRINADSSTIRCEFDYPDELNGFFLETEFVAEYDADISDVPESVLPIPWLANICPLAWATGVDVELPRLDERYWESLIDVRQALEEMYPQFIQASEIRCQELVSNEGTRRDSENAALLFSGGVDAFATYYRHRDEDPTLITVHGFDVDMRETDAWEEKMERVEAFAEPRGLNSFSVKTNMMSFLESFMLNAHFRRFLQSDWYDAVQQGIGITGLCAPLAFSQQIDRLYMADGASEKYDIKVGNHPNIVNNVAWSHTSVQSDGYELTRQEKIETLADFIRENDIVLHTCLESGPGNCGVCEKCLRTAFGLVLAGLDPNRYGYPFDESRFEYAREQLENGEWKLGPAKATMWRDLQDHARRDAYDRPEAEEFFDWLADVDIDRFVDYSNSSGFTAYKLTRRLPPSAPVHTLRRQVLDVIW